MKEHFSRLIRLGHLAHAYLFVGPDAHPFVEDLVKELTPSGHMLDVMRLAATRDEDGKVHDIPIEETKALRSWISLRPMGAHKCVIIQDADRLGGEAANNLLKILEEPPAYAHFFLTTTRPGQVMGTIASRCERVTVAQKVSARTDLAGKLAGKEVAELGKALKAPVLTKLAYAKKLADDPQALETVTAALTAVHRQLPTRPDLVSVAHGLLELVDILSQPQFNRRLAIEHFLLTCQS